MVSKILLVYGPHLAFAEGARERGEPILAAPHEVGVGIGATLDQEPRYRQCRSAREIEARTAGIEQRFPIEIAAALVDEGWIGIEKTRYGLRIAHARGGP